MVAEAASSRKAQTGTADPIIQNIAEEDKIPWYSKPNLRILYLLLFPTCMGIELTSGFDSQLINALQIVPAWQKYFANTPQGTLTSELKGIIAAVYSLGSIVSLPFIGIINERYGRRWSIFGGSVVMVIGALIQGFSVNAAMYIVARLLLGLGIPICIVAGSSLIGELSYPKERSYLTSYFNVAFYLGQIAAAAICFGTNNIVTDMSWRIPSWLQMAPSLMQIAFIFMIPESPRWLLSKGKQQEAYDILAKYHGEGTGGDEFVKAEFAHMKATIELEMETSKRSYLDLFRTAGMRRRTLISAALGLFNQWSGNTLISYYLNDLLNMIGRKDSLFKQQINVALSCWSLVCGVVIVQVCCRMKRVTAAYICTGSLLAVYIAWTISMERAIAAVDQGQVNAAANGAVLAFIFLYKPCYQIFYNALTYTYLVEIWPYFERSRGIAMYQLFSRCAAFFTTFVNPIGLDAISWKYLITYCCILAVEIAFVYFFFPETSGRTLEELAFLFEDRALTEQANTAALEAMKAPKDGAETFAQVETIHGRKDEKV